MFIKLEICVSTAFGELENVPVDVNYDVDFGLLDYCRISEVNLEGLNLSRDQLVKWTSEAEVDRQETFLADEIADLLRDGELEEAA